jgi:hypothetical protein
MTKADLRTGMVVTVKNGRKYRVFRDAHTQFKPNDVFVRLIGEGWFDFDDLNEDLTEKNKHIFNDLTIVKVEEERLTTGLISKDLEGYRNVIWERPEEPQYYNGEVVCIESSTGFTKGKIYTFVNGKTVDDDGTKRPTNPYPGYKSINEGWLRDKFIEVVR